ncbi:response regulator transcription factor [Ascidiimonas sp. W6]|uniref:response regulator transcription factor n=1 Tax=Ascidiimonas meishanensis TaxID=3128903 RepID=UPI0030EB8428
MKQTIIIFTVLIVAVLSLFQISKYTLLAGETTIEMMIAGIAITFFMIGVILHKKSLRSPLKNETQIKKENITKTGLTEREYEVLSLVALGLSNKEIAIKLFVTESTIKTHVSNVLVKLDARRRTEAIQKAKILHLIEF